jgi:NADH-quinone oxidoreductase subunit A
MLTEFGKVFAFILTAVMFVLVAIFAAKLIRPARPTKEKLTTYECGENPEGSPWVKFNIRFYVVALIFLIFDVEVVMLIPWALVYQDSGMLGFLVGAIFLMNAGISGWCYLPDITWFRNGVRMEKRGSRMGSSKNRPACIN